MGKQMVALITNMDQPLGRMVGNAMEVSECIEVLHGGGPEDLRELCLHLAAWMFYLGGATKTVAEGKVLAGGIIASGKAFERFRQMVELQGGDIGVINDPSRLPSADCRVEARSAAGGFVSSIACEHIGTACVILGGGREKKEDAVDPAVGIVVHKKIGDRVSLGEALCTIHCHSEASAERAKKMIAESYTISAAAPAHRPSLIHRVIYRGEH
jgi:pyrimidine-nucleoside phosphorylase/thymidine phosphorylase